LIYVTKGKTHEVTLLDHLPIESGAIYLFARGYWDFARLYRLHHSLAFFIIRAGMLPTPVQSPVINNIIHEPMNLLHNPHAIASIEYYTKSPPRIQSQTMSLKRRRLLKTLRRICLPLRTLNISIDYRNAI